MKSGETKIWMPKKTLPKMNPWTQTMSNPKTKRNRRPLKHPHNPFWITAPEINSQKKAAQFPPSVTAPKKQHMKFLISFQKPRSLLCKNSIKPKILCIIYKSVIFMLEKTIKNQDHRLYPVQCQVLSNCLRQLHLSRVKKIQPSKKIYSFFL